ncbi:hypothetical protein VM98_34415, partial [Streptomyces rubellomurinus subsp. indigoferus]
RWAGRAQDLSEPGRLPELAPGARPGGAAGRARLLAERYDGEILLLLRDAVLGRPMAGPPPGAAARLAGRAQDLSEPGRLPELAPGARPGGAARLARLLAERSAGAILLILRDAALSRSRAAGN